VSNHRHADAKLKGFAGPFFPPSVTALNELLDEHGRSIGNLYQLTDLAKSLWFVRSEAPAVFFSEDQMPYEYIGHQPHTSDGYEWYSWLVLTAGVGSVAVLIPWKQDHDQQDDTARDRSTAVYTVLADQPVAEAVLQRLIAAIQTKIAADAAPAAEPPATIVM
jgi:hypothetical protein